jgi:hypothetical protein
MLAMMSAFTALTFVLELIPVIPDGECRDLR